jgi:hypothetical protein
MAKQLKIWEGNEKGDDRIIAFLDNTICKGNPVPDETQGAIYDLKSGNIPAKNFTGVPFSYLKKIEMQEGKNYISLLFGKDSSEELMISDDQKRKEIFDFFKTNIPNTKFEVDSYSKIRAGKKPLIAMTVVALLFLWTLYIIHGMENGNQYDVPGGHYNSLAGIVLILASLGLPKAILLFSCLMGIAVFSFIQKTKSPKVVSRITWLRGYPALK